MGTFSTDNNVRAAHVGRARDDSVKKGCNASANSECSKRNNMETLAQGENFDGKDAVSQEKGSTESRDESTQLSSNVVSSTQDETVGGNKRQYAEDNHEAETADEEGSKRKKKKENEEKEPMGRPLLVGQRGPGRVLTGSKPPGPASKTGASQLGKSGGGQNAKGSGGSGKGNAQSQGKGGSGGKANAQSSHQSKSSGSKGSGSQGGKQDRKSPVASPKPNLGKDSEGDSEEQKSQESSGPKVPPLKIVIPGGGAASRSEQEGEGTRGSGKGRGNMSTLPYVIPCTSNDTGQTSDSSDGNSDDKRPSEGGKAGQRVLRSHRTNDGDKDKDKERTSPQSGSDSRSAQNQLNSNKSPQPSSSVSNISILL
ncbi:hypothetical protein O3G_MSEX010595 [Manduca sexta]|uniref:Uncharacterized protein n=1 Tax=Manduca sexta TaxID=7130 RepID=A0A922CTQ4_MANSE|nr:hypothetical protein O3G_MSEX010595 [Manduca sexta]